MTGSFFGLLAPSLGQYSLSGALVAKGFVVFKHRVDDGELEKGVKKGVKSTFSSCLDRRLEMN